MFSEAYVNLFMGVYTQGRSASKGRGSVSRGWGSASGVRGPVSMEARGSASEGSASRELGRPLVVTSSGSHCTSRYASYWNMYSCLKFVI